MNALKHKNKDGRLVKLQDIAEESNASYNTVKKIAKEAGAFVKIGRLAFVDQELYYNYIREKYTVKD